MGWATYTAQRDLAPGHLVGSQYTVELSLTHDGFVFQGRDLKIKNKMLSGRVETIYHGRERLWHVVLEPVEEGDSTELREFLGSTADGQPFVFDPFGSIAAPAKTMIVTRDDEGAVEDAFLRTGSPEARDCVQFSFDIRQAA
jgi:hypothetical protein